MLFHRETKTVMPLEATAKRKRSSVYGLHSDPRPEPTEAQKAKALAIAATRRAVRNAKRAALAKRNDGTAIINVVIPHVILRGDKLAPKIFQKGSK